LDASRIPGVIVKSQERAAISTLSSYSSTSSQTTGLPPLKELFLISAAIEAERGERIFGNKGSLFKFPPRGQEPGICCGKVKGERWR